LLPFEAMSLNSLAIARMKQDRLDESRELFEQAIAIYDATGNRRMVAGARANLAIVEQTLGRLGAAIEQLEGAHRELEALGDDEGRTLVAFNLAYVLAVTGDAPRARRYLAEAEPRYGGDWEVIWIDARLQWLEGDHAGARAGLERAKELAGDAWEPPLEAALSTTEPLEPRQ
ncbi:MAG TPA: tetratricopeptide repeat protein, partial [Thermoanaerobaculia bacterium]|nr:tetratricopeptide repeat protein [Thermoanaerobaculia bacterium]